MKQGVFAVRWKLAACGRPVLEDDLPREVKRMSVLYRAHIAERIVSTLTRANDDEMPAHDAQKAGTVLIFWEIKGRGEICAGAEIPHGEPVPPLQVRRLIACRLSDALRDGLPRQ